uniref:HNH endonuclease signature motif containing protein n=1 Tax=Paenibacillus massiliensis TaxID=225917 RepID=UPI001CF76D1C
GNSGGRPVVTPQWKYNLHEAVKSLGGDGKFKTNALRLPLDIASLEEFMQRLANRMNLSSKKLVPAMIGDGSNGRPRWKFEDYSRMESDGPGGFRRSEQPPKDHYEDEPKRREDKTEGTGEAQREPNHENIQEFVKGNKKFDEVLDDYALIYGEIVKSNKYWSWADDFVGKLSADQRKKIKDRALELNTDIPHIEVKKVEGLKFGYADFEGAGLVIVQDKLPKHLWLATDEDQFKWLNDRLPNKVQPEGTVWHHNEKDGIMQLVPFGIHNITKHNGGRTKGHWADAPRKKSKGSEKKTKEGPDEES